MNSNYGRSSNKSGSSNAFDFDLGLGSGRGKSMNNNRNQSSSYSSSTYTYSSSNTTSSWTNQPSKPAWTHQPAAKVQSGGIGSLSGPTSMAGDIFGKTWNCSTPSNSGIGLVDNKNPNLFGDLLSSTMGQNRSSGNVPLKSAAAAASKSSFSMGGMADSLPKTVNSTKTSGTWGSSVGNTGGNSSFGGNFSSNSSTFGGVNMNLGGNKNQNPNLGGPSMKSMAGSGIGSVGMGASKDPFGSLVDFGSKPLGGMNSAKKESDKSGFGNDSFGDFQNAASGSSASYSSDAFPTSKSDPFDNFGFSNQNQTSGQSKSDPLDSFGFSTTPAKSEPLNDFGFSTSQNQTSGHASGGNDFDALFSSPSNGGQHYSETDDWGINSEFEGGHDTGGTTEIEGLPPPPAGVSVSSAKQKGMDNYKQGQFADAIKWLSWAFVLLEKAGDVNSRAEVLTSRASCYKEVGEYKKAVADCTKVLENDSKNVSVLVQRALLYESMEKYKLGAEDLRTVMKIDPGNRVARSTVHRLAKMAE